MGRPANWRGVLAFGSDYPFSTPSQCRVALSAKSSDSRLANSKTEGLGGGPSHGMVGVYEFRVCDVLPKGEEDIQRMAVDDDNRDAVPNREAVRWATSLHDAPCGLFHEARRNFIRRNAKVRANPWRQDGHPLGQIRAAVEEHGEERLHPGRFRFRRFANKDVSLSGHTGAPSLGDSDRPPVRPF